MKRIFCTVAVAFLAVAAMSAQIFSMGVKAGYNVTLERGQVFSSAIQETFNVKGNLQNGFNVGVYARIGRALYVQPEVNYNYYTYKQDLATPLGAIETKKYVMSTFDIPLLVGYSIINSSFFKLRVMAGPRFSFNAGSTKGGSWEEYVETVRDARVGLDCGLGVDVWRFNLDVRYNLFPDLYKRQDHEGNVINSNVLNQFEVSLGFRIFGGNASKK